MKNLTGKDLHPNFIKFSKYAEEKGHEIIALKETYENTKFSIDGYKFDFFKLIKNYKSFYDFVIKTINLQKEIERLKNEKN